MNEIRVQALIAELEVLDGWSRRDEVRAELCLTLARKLDQDAGMATAAVARELRAALEELQANAPQPESNITRLMRESKERREREKLARAEAGTSWLGE